MIIFLHKRVKEGEGEVIPYLNMLDDSIYSGPIHDIIRS